MYFRLGPLEPVRYRAPRDYVEQFRDVLEAAVRERVSASPVAVMMSGGLDSSTLAAIAAGPGGRDADRCLAVTAVYDTLFDDPERDFSSATARALGLPIEHVPVDGYDLFARWDQDAGPPEPSVEALSAIMRDLLLRAGRHADVALTGDGGDPALLPGAVVRHVGRVPSVALARGVWQTLQRGRWPPLGLHSGLRRWTASDRPAAPPWLASRLHRACDPAARWAAYHGRLAPLPDAAWRGLVGPGGAGMAAGVRERRSEHHRPARRAALPFLRRPRDLACPVPAVVPLVHRQDRAARRDDRPAARRHPPAAENRTRWRSGGAARMAGPERWWP